jgi:hypothetical protein
MASPERLYFITRSDLSEGRRCAMVAHAMDLWTEAHGPQRGTVIVYAVKDENALLTVKDKLPTGSRHVLFREPDLAFEATALATDAGPFRLSLLGHTR